ncbi:uncharacterized protein BDZ99DRAFT_97066 [Mytilinidion resinicola]|uniref:Uncharacterized protein n=1 Tax=Mytilinidion resinicola TaxID=574789 RepID=A0A6A6YF99_9PEZI|nr:uncharacterized protein BDZ99DRAFT_97066 [Mytilinidion resinicola]KAF2806537.1 hypothetical protein BDZ99DRAFT_97066 [Mytilinidion resinicola]
MVQPATLHPLPTPITFLKTVLSTLTHTQLTALGNALTALLTITRSFLATERTAHLPFSLLLNLPDDAEINRFILYCDDLSRVIDAISNAAARVGSVETRAVRPLVDTIRLILLVLDRFWVLFEEERWRGRGKRIASLQRLEGVLGRLGGLAGSALVGAADGKTETETENGGSEDADEGDLGGLCP